MSESAVLRTLSMMLAIGVRMASSCPRAESAALAASETMVTKPSAATTPRLAARARISDHQGSSGGLTSHVALSADCISPKMPEAVTITTMAPKTVAVVPETGSLDRATMDLMRSPPSGPTSPLNS
jgi:hypothetical protein